MRTWESAKKSIKSLTFQEKEELEAISKVVSRVITRRQELGLSREQLAAISNVQVDLIERMEVAGELPEKAQLQQIFYSLNL